MRELVPVLRHWQDAGAAYGLATVVAVSGSAPRPPGAAMAVGPDGEVLGSISGGCVEGAVFDLTQAVVAGGAAVLARFGYSDDTAFAVGLSCGGIVDVLVEPAGAGRLPWFAEVLASIDAGEPVAVATVLPPSAAGTPPDGDGPPADAYPDPVHRPAGCKLGIWADRVAGTSGSPGLDAAVTADARGMLASGSTGLRHYGASGERRREEVGVFVDAFAPPPRLYVFGAIDYAAAMSRVGVFLGYRVTVCDARPVFATRSRFPDAHEVVVDWPHRFLAGAPVDAQSAIAVLTHDPKFDVPLLEVALRTPAAYVGAMGSRRTHAERLERLRERGLTEEELARLHSPIGLDLGARTPEETAVSIAAELVQCRWGGSGRSLRATDGAIHH